MKVAILGTAEGWRCAPFDDASYEIWGLNTCYKLMSPAQLSKVTRWFELHPTTSLTKARRPDDHWESLAALKVPVYSFAELPGVETRIFPLDQAIAAGKDYFSCTMCYQVALALSEGATHIELYGISLTGTLREVVVERPCLEWWLGLAEGRGVTVKVTHAYRHGIGEHPFRYAADDQDERADSYQYCLNIYGRGMVWLLEEQNRLWRAGLDDLNGVTYKDSESLFADDPVHA